MAIFPASHGSNAADAPARNLRAVNLSDTGTLTGLAAESPSLWLYVSDTGDIVVVAENDTGEQLLTVAAPMRLDVRAKRVLATGTSVTKVVAAF